MIQFQHQEVSIPTSGGQKGFNSNIKRVIFQHEGDKRGSIPIPRGLYSDNRKQTGYNSNIKRVVFQHQGDKRGSNIERVMFQHQGNKRGTIPTSRGLCSSSASRRTKGVQFQHQEGYIPTVGGKMESKEVNSNNKVARGVRSNSRGTKMFIPTECGRKDIFQRQGKG